MHTGPRLYKILLLENKATCKVMNLIKLAQRHLNYRLVEEGQTALGPALLMSIAIASRVPGSNVSYQRQSNTPCNTLVYCR